MLNRKHMAVISNQLLIYSRNILVGRATERRRRGVLIESNLWIHFAK